MLISSLTGRCCAHLANSSLTSCSALATSTFAHSAAQAPVLVSGRAQDGGPVSGQWSVQSSAWREPSGNAGGADLDEGRTNTARGLHGSTCHASVGIFVVLNTGREDGQQHRDGQRPHPGTKNNSIKNAFLIIYFYVLFLNISIKLKSTSKKLKITVQVASTMYRRFKGSG